VVKAVTVALLGALMIAAFAFMNSIGFENTAGQRAVLLLVILFALACFLGWWASRSR
jgi:hypothetical protein